MRSLIGLVLLSSSSLFACNAVVEVGSNGDAGAKETVDASPILFPDGAAPGSFTTEQVQAAEAACNAPHGDVDPYTDVSDLTSRLVGAWYLCGSQSGGIVDDAGTSSPTYLNGAGASSVWGSDGSWTLLTSDGSGGLIEGKGITSTGAFTVIDLDDATTSCEPSGCILGFELGTPMSAGPQFGEQFGAEFETNPRRMFLAGTDWFVPIQ